MSFEHECSCPLFQDAERRPVINPIEAPARVGNDGQVDFTPVATATYHVAAGGRLNSVGTYTLSVDEVADGL